MTPVHRFNVRDRVEDLRVAYVRRQVEPVLEELVRNRAQVAIPAEALDREIEALVGAIASRDVQW